MDYVISCDKVPIGTIRNPGADPGMGFVNGPFVPLPAYKKVQPVFRRFVEATHPLLDHDDPEALKLFYQERDALDLSVTTEAGLPIPVEWVHVYDYGEELGDDGYEGTFHVSFDSLFEPSGIFFEDKRFWQDRAIR